MPSFATPLEVAPYIGQLSLDSSNDVSTANTQFLLDKVSDEIRNLLAYRGLASTGVIASENYIPQDNATTGAIGKILKGLACELVVPKLVTRRLTAIEPAAIGVYKRQLKFFQRKLALLDSGDLDLAWLDQPIPSVRPSARTTVFTGSGLNDFTSSGDYTGKDGDIYTVIIDGTSSPNTFKWQKNSGAFTSGVAITGTNQALSDGVSIKFNAITGHTLNDQWATTVTVYGKGSDVQGYIPSFELSSASVPTKAHLDDWIDREAPVLYAIATNFGYSTSNLNHVEAKMYGTTIAEVVACYVLQCLSFKNNFGLVNLALSDQIQEANNSIEKWLTGSFNDIFLN
ncbi:MAG: hypothetical protein WAQ98_11055 [Blastocatellia bacterium]